MKAIVKSSPNPAIIAANADGDIGLQLMELAKKHNAKFITADDHTLSAAQLLGEKSTRSSEADYPDFDEPCIVFAGFDRAALNAFLDDMGRIGLKISLKAMYTPHNRDWSLAHLAAELMEERSYMRGGEGK